jgi:putative PEP-CTERM system TPR-repeat lipoprotein
MLANSCFPAHTARLPALVVCLGSLLVGACSRDPQAVKARYLASAQEYASQGKLAEAAVEYQNALMADPLDGEVRLQLAETFVKVGEVRRAAGEFVRAGDILVDRADVQVKAGNLLLFGRRFDDAKVRAEKALAAAPRNVEAQILLANSLAGLKDLNAAVAEIEEAIKLEPERGATYANLGVLEVGRGRWDAAETAFKKAIELDQRSAQAHLALANFYWAGRRVNDAEQALKRALALDPENTLVLRATANFAMAQNRPDEAETHLKKIAEVTKAPEAVIALADFYIARKDEATARNLLQSLESSVAATPVAIRVAALDHAAGRKDSAYAKLEQVLASDKANLQALLVKSTMLLSDGRRDEALSAAEQATQANPESTAAFFTLGRVQTARNQADAAIAAFTEALRLNPRATGARVALARLHLAGGKAADSVSFAQDAVKADPLNPEARLILVRGLIAQGDFERADSELTRLLTQYPNAALVHVQKGLLLGRRRDLAGARKAFEAALKSDPDSVEALEGLVALDLTAKQPVSALERVTGRAARADATTGLLMLAARTHATAGDLEGAEKLLRRVLEKDSTHLAAYAALGQIYFKQGRLDDALREFEAMAKRDGKPVAALTLAGMILQAQGKSSDAKARFERVMEIDPNAPVAANNLAWMYADAGGNLDIALHLAQTAHRGLPDSAEVNNTLGIVYYKKSLYAMAIPPLKLCAEKDPSRAAYHLYLGLAYAKSGNAESARQSLGRALALKPDVDGAQEARALLESLKASE